MDGETWTAALRLGGAAFVIALTGAMAPGPLLTVTITETVRRGRLSAVMLLVGHALLEAALLVGFAFGLQEFLGRETVTDVLAVVGGVFLVWMGGSLLADAVSGRLTLHLEADRARPRRGGPVLTGAAVSLSNPYWTIWWVTIGVKLASDGLALGPAGVGMFFIGHELADFAWYMIVIFAVHSGRRFLSDRVYRWVVGVCAAFLVYLGLAFATSVL
jgi:threonine/homoserine/homoserine lactone efflux protein